MSDSNVLVTLFSRLSGPYGLLILFVCAVIVTLSVLGIIKPSALFEQEADDFIKAQTGVDLEQVEKQVLQKE